MRKVAVPSHFLLLLAVLVSQSAVANSVYLGFTQNDYTVVLGEQSTELSPNGPIYSFDFDVSENLNLNAHYTDLNDSDLFNNILNIDFELSNFSAGLNYQINDWSVYYQYGRYSDEQSLTDVRVNVLRRNMESEADTHSLGASYFWSIDHWQYGVTLGVHFSDFEQLTENLPPAGPNQQPPPLEVIIEDGDATTLSISGNIAHFIPMDTERYFVIGVYLGWNEVTDSDSEIFIRNGRNIGNLRLPSNRSIGNNLNVLGSESYGQANIYLSYDLTESWVMDLDAAFDFGTDDNTQAITFGIGYYF